MCTHIETPLSVSTGWSEVLELLGLLVSALGNWMSSPTGGVGWHGKPAMLAGRLIFVVALQ